jgi:uncharacterized protein (TIRG00374 family)
MRNAYVNIIYLCAAFIKKRMLFVQVGLLIGIVMYLFSKVNIYHVVSIILSISPIVFFETLAIITIVNLLAGYRWFLIVNSISDRRLNYFTCLIDNYAGVFVNQIFFSGIGGDGVKFFLMHKHGFSFSPCIIAVAADKIMTLLGLFMLLVVGLLTANIIQHPIYEFFSFLLLLSTSLFVVIYFVFNQKISFIVFGFLTRISNENKLINSTKILFEHKTAVVLSILVSIFAFILMSIIIYITANSLSFNLSILQSISLCPPAFFAVALPISLAGWGIRESALVFMLSYAGLPPEQSVSLSLILGTIVLIGSLPGSISIGYVGNIIKSGYHHKNF